MALTNAVITDRTSVLFTLMDDDGTANAAFGSVITKFALGGNITVTAPQDAERFEHPGAWGGFTTFTRMGLGEVTWRQYVGATSEANLRLGVGRLTDLITRGGYYLRLTAGVTRWLPFEPSSIQAYSGRELELHDIYQAFAFRQGLDIKLVCQPYWEGGEVTGSAVTVPNDPATSTKVRVYPITVSGDLPTPAQVRVQIGADSRTLSLSAAADDIIDATAHGFAVGDAVVFTSLTGGAGLTVGVTYYVVAASFGANTFRIATGPGGSAIGFTTDITAGAVQLAGTVEKILVAARPRLTAASTVFSTWLSDTGYFNCEASGRNWTITLGTDTASAADLDASGGNTARCSAVSNATVLRRRVRATRTTNLDSLRGSWDVWVRTKLGGPHIFYQLRYGLSTADPAPITLPEVDIDASAVAGSGDYVEKMLGTIHIPTEDSITLGALAVELWTRAESGSGNVDNDFIWFVPHDQTGTILATGGSKVEVAGSALVTPVTSPAGGTAGVVVGTTLKLDTTTDNAGLEPAAGTVLAAGRYRVTWKVHGGAIAAAGETIRFVVRNVTATGDSFSRTMTYHNGDHSFSADFVADGTSAYQEQVDDPSAANKFWVMSIAREILPVIARNESARTDPTRAAVDHLDTSGNVLRPLANQGALMATLWPGDNHVMIRCDESPLAGFDDPQNQLERTPTVTVSYFPRYPL